MTENRDETNSKDPSPVAALAILFSLCGVIIGVLAVNLFLLEPYLRGVFGVRVGQSVYILVRIVSLVVLAYGLAKNAKRNRFQTLSTVLLVGFIDQVLLKGLSIKHEMVLHPADWVGLDPSNTAIFLNMAIGYLFFTPIILILAFFGMESTRFRKDWRLGE